MFSVLPLERISEDYGSWNEYNFIPICDYLICSHHLGYIKNENGIYLSYNHTHKICDNIFDMIELIDSDSEKIY